MSKRGEEKAKKEDEPLICLGCLKKKDDKDLGIECGGGHYIHGESCLRKYISSQFENGKTNFKCPNNCAHEFPNERMEALMTEEEMVQYNKFAYVLDDEIFFGCPFCDFGAVYQRDDVPLFFFCERPQCKKMSCTVCHKECVFISKNQNYDEDEEEETKEADNKDAERHFLCEELAPLKKKVEDAILEGNTNSCPKCKFKVGRKDEKCNQINCINCGIQWCYCCGKALDDVGGMPHLFSGNDWQIEKKNCPAWLKEFHEKDQTWPDDDSKAVDEYHREKILYCLQNVILSMSDDDRKRVWKNFPESVYPYKLEDVLKFELRKVFRRRWTKKKSKAIKSKIGTMKT